MEQERSLGSGENAHLVIGSQVEDTLAEPLRLGERVREIRKGRNWTLEEVSQRTGLARSTLSKIENEQMSPTFEAVQKLAAGLGIEVPQLFISAEHRPTLGRRSITSAGEGKKHPTPTYEHELLCTEIARKKMVPFKSTIRVRSFDEFSGWVRHEGEEFLLVLSGKVLFYSEFYEPVALGEGDSAYYDAAMGHACVSTGPEDAVVLWVTAA
ncbi:MAG: XRE family transcriptional regulator [Pseudomonadota bacterium]